MTGMLTVQTPSQSPSTSHNFLSLEPEAMAKRAGVIATVLADIIEKQQLYTMIGGKKHVQIAGWATMGSFLGYLPREVWVKELPDGSYEAMVELYSIHTGQIVGQASSLCSIKESRWGKAEKYARRSMAITRATGKAYRLGFAWVMAMAGYEGTPAEEMPHQVEEVTPLSSIYTGDPRQKPLLMEAFGRHAITDPQVMIKLARDFGGQPLNEIDIFIENAIDEGRIES